MTRRSRTLICLVLLLTLSSFRGLAAPQPSHAGAVGVSALFLSDIHFDPLRDPGKAGRLNAAPADQWARILASPATPDADAEYAAINKSCPIKPLVDPSDQLWQSALKAIHTQALKTHARFAVVSGDLIAHQYECRYQHLFPGSSHADFLGFVMKTETYVIRDLQAALPGIPIYIAMGNNDSGCHDNRLSPHDDDFLALTAKLVAGALPGSARAEALHTLPRGYYSAPLPAPMAHTRILVLDDVYQMAAYKTCADQPDPDAQDAQLAWLAQQLKDIRARHEQAWVVAHVPPGVNPYTAYNTHPDMCSGGAPAMFLSSDKLSDLLAENADIVRLGVFGHSHTDEMRLLRPEDSTGSGERSDAGVPVKIVPAISPVFAELPSFMVGRIDPRTATLEDYSVILASNSTGIGTTWAKSYTFSSTYHHLPAYSSSALNKLIEEFQLDPSAEKPESQAYLREYRHYFFADGSAPIQPHWVGYACAMDHISAESFKTCACPAQSKAP